MNKISLTALQFFSNLYQKVENIDDIFIEVSKDTRFPDPLRIDCATASQDIDFCYNVIEALIDFVRNNDLPENGNKNSD